MEAKLEESNKVCPKHMITDPIPTKYWKLGDLRLVIWRDKLLPKIERMSHSSANLRQLQGDHGSKEAFAILASSYLVWALNGP
mmetsp:Transcript_79445/g.246419  ORF Transcript_79445/g.246419 Transcript_79445/m.246419 type:complete len:83 (+) Transcript_79445:331-579(+)